MAEEESNSGVEGLRDRVQKAIEESSAAGELKGLPVHWSMWLDMLDGEDQWWWAIVTKENQLPTVTIGHGEMIKEKSWDTEEEDED